MSGAAPSPRQPKVDLATTDPTGADDVAFIDDLRWGYIENDGVLFRGPSRHLPKIVWNFRDQRWAIYTGPCPPKSLTWGTDITEAEAQVLMSTDW